MRPQIKFLRRLIVAVIAVLAVIGYGVRAAWVGGTSESVQTVSQIAQHSVPSLANPLEPSLSQTASARSIVNAPIRSLQATHDFVSAPQPTLVHNADLIAQPSVHEWTSIVVTVGDDRESLNRTNAGDVQFAGAVQAIAPTFSANQPNNETVTVTALPPVSTQQAAPPQFQSNPFLNSASTPAKSPAATSENFAANPTESNSSQFSNDFQAGSTPILNASVSNDFRPLNTSASASSTTNDLPATPERNSPGEPIAQLASNLSTLGPGISPRSNPNPNPNPSSNPSSNPNLSLASSSKPNASMAERSGDNGVNPNPPGVLANASSFVLAAQPQPGDHWKDDRPQTDRRAILTETIPSDFSPDALNESLPYDPDPQMNVYAGKTLNAVQRPLLELGRPWYQLGQLSPGSTIFGKHNPTASQFLVYGDYRTAFASNQQNGNGTTLTAAELNLDVDWQITSTERFHAFLSPLDNGVTNSGYVFDDRQFVNQLDANFDFGYFEGDLGAMVGGMTNRTLPFDFPFAIGVMPLLLQNGVWMEDAFLGVAATIPARNSARLDISNMDITFFAGYDKITSPAFQGDDSAGKMYGTATFIEALSGYIELDYAFLEDRTIAERSYHNIGMGYTRRYGRFVSNSTRMIVNTGQSSEVVANTADGVLLLSENSLITGSPSTLVPYFNFFAGFDRPQSAARAGQAGGILRNTGILFETDGMTNYPTLDATANDTFGGAAGVNLLPNLAQQLVVEAAWLNVMGNDLTRNAAGNQYGVGLRYQLPLTHALIFRADAMVGFLEDDSDIHGVRVELRHKW